MMLIMQACSSEPDGDEIGLEKSVKAEVVKVVRHQVPDLHFFPGRVKSKVSITLAAKMPGYVRNVPHEIGDSVKKGELLVGLDDTDIRAGINALEHSFRAVSRQREALRAKLRYVETTSRRISRLHDEGSATQDEYDRISSEKSALSGQVSALEARARQVKARLEEARNQLRYVAIKAPSDGKLTRRMVDRGTFVMPGVPLVQFESSGEGSWFAADVDESLISKVSSGMPVSIFVPSVQRMVQAEITRTAPDSSPASHTFSILCDISSSGLNSGLYGRIYITAGQRTKLLVPCTALVDRGGITGVYVADQEKKLHWRLIKTGNCWMKTGADFFPLPVHDALPDSKGCFTEVLTGLSAGEEVTVSSLDKVHEGFRLD